jgi:hypothetical protein
MFTSKDGNIGQIVNDTFLVYVWTGSLIPEIATTNQKKSVKYKNKKTLETRFGIRFILSLWTERK